MKRRKYDHEVLLLQGGGALGAYQAGVYEGLAEGGMTPTWVVGISIGAINSAIIAGNPPDRRVERLRIFWDRVSAQHTFEPPSWMEALRPMLTRLSVASIFNWGVPIFFAPRPIPPLFAGSGSLDALSFYDTAPLRHTLEELVDFDLINRRAVRLSLGAVNVRTGESVYFDNHKMRLGPEHVMASGALPPGFPAVKIDGHYYWDGGIVSNSPLTYVVDEKPLQARSSSRSTSGAPAAICPATWMRPWSGSRTSSSPASSASRTSVFASSPSCATPWGACWTSCRRTCGPTLTCASWPR
jgi:NTE family protein